MTKQEEVRHDLVDGDYQIIVHVIEARDLNPVDVENGTADPVVVAKLSFPSSVVEARQNTIRKVNTLNPVFDHTMIFREKSVPVRPPAAPAAAPPPPAHPAPLAGAAAHFPRPSRSPFRPALTPAPPAPTRLGGGGEARDPQAVGARLEHRVARHGDRRVRLQHLGDLQA